MVYDTSSLRYEYHRLFRTIPDNKKAIREVDKRLKPNALGVQIKVNGKVIGVIKDRFAAERVFARFKAKYIPAKSEQKQVVTIASFSEGYEPVQQTQPRVLEEVKFLQDISFENVTIAPQDVLSEDQVMQLLNTGGKARDKYTVQDGDTLSEIAHKFGMSMAQIRSNNKWIVDDTIYPDDIVDVTKWQPVLSVKTIEVETEKQDINYTTVYKTDASLKKGKTVVVRPGIEGKKIATYRLTKINGVLTDEELVNETVISRPRTAIVRRGSKIIKGEGSGNFRWPVSGARVSSGYGFRWGRLHKGVDLISSNRTIMAADAGRIVYAGYKSDYGNHIIIDHGNGYETLYGHLRSMSVHVGDVVEAGEQIGIMGNTGDSTGTHLHFEVHKNGVIRNPAAYLN
jgi:murein DD-endopeptidase MepM/ murein hydrolase activator NlpD